MHLILVVYFIIDRSIDTPMPRVADASKNLHCNVLNLEICAKAMDGHKSSRQLTLYRKSPEDMDLVPSSREFQSCPSPVHFRYRMKDFYLYDLKLKDETFKMKHF